MPLKADATNPHLELCFKDLPFSNMKAICVFKRPKGWQLRKSWLPLCSLGQWQTSNLFPWLGVIPNRFRQSQLHCKQNRFRLAHRCKQHTAASRSGVCEHAPSSKHPSCIKIASSGCTSPTFTFLWNGLVLAALKTAPAWAFIRLSVGFLCFHHAAPHQEASLSLQRCASLTSYSVRSSLCGFICLNVLMKVPSHHNPIHLHCLKHSNMPGHLWALQCEAASRDAKYQGLRGKCSLLSLPGC